MFAKSLLKRLKFRKQWLKVFSTKDDKFWEEYTKMKKQGGKYPALGTQSIIANNAVYSWRYSDKHSLIESELYECLSELKRGEVAPFVVLDVRDEIEYDFYKLPVHNKVLMGLF
jgi:hypothetical protein